MKLTNQRKIIIGIAIIISFVLGAVFNSSYEKYEVIVKNEKDNNTSLLGVRESLFMNFYSYPTDIVFLGDSITQGFEWSDVFPDLQVKNRGINSDTSEGVLARLETIRLTQPKKVFLMIGINDLLLSKDFEKISNNHKAIINYFKKELPSTKLYIESILPVSSGNISNNEIIVLNDMIKSICDNEGVEYIDLFSLMVTNNNEIEPTYTVDGVHLSVDGYYIWINELKKYLFN